MGDGGLHLDNWEMFIGHLLQKVGEGMGFFWGGDGK